MPPKSRKKNKEVDSGTYNGITKMWRNSSLDHIFQLWSIDNSGCLVIGKDLNDFPEQKIKIGPDVWFTSMALSMRDLHVGKIMLSISTQTDVRLFASNLVFAITAPKPLQEWQKRRAHGPLLPKQISKFLFHPYII